MTSTCLNLIYVYLGSCIVPFIKEFYLGPIVEHLSIKKRKVKTYFRFTSVPYKFERSIISQNQYLTVHLIENDITGTR